MTFSDRVREPDESRPETDPIGEESSTDHPAAKSPGPEGPRDGRVRETDDDGSPRPLPRPGERLGTFRLLRKIGAGGMGAVFLALDERLDRQVALKVLPQPREGDGESVGRFDQEARSAARLDHDRIARVFSIGADKGFHYIAFEYIEGTTIRERVVAAGGPIPVAEAVTYALQIAEALIHASGRGVVHRDVKPSNVVITPEGRAKLVDMGLARRFERDKLDGGLTQSGTTLGSFDYISPEQARDPRDVDVRGDLYSLGCTIFHMLAGRPPFPDGTVLQKLLQHQEEPPPDLLGINPAVPPALAAIVARLMEKDRERRYQTPEALARDLDGFAGSIGLATPREFGLGWGTSPDRSSWERHLVWAIPAVGLSLIVAALAWLGRPNPGVGVVNVDPPRPFLDGSNGRVVDPTGRDDPRVKADPIGTKPTPDGAPEVPRVVVVESSRDLGALLEAARDGTTLVLAGDGPFSVGLAEPPAPGSIGVGRRLTIRAAPGSRPVLKGVAKRSPASSSETGLIAVRGGSLKVEGVEFQLDGVEAAGGSAILAIDAEVLLDDCRIRRTPARADALDGPTTGVRLVATGLDDDDLTAPEVTARAAGCLIDGGLVGIRASGPVDLHLRDCEFATDGYAVWLDDPDNPGRFAASDLLIEDARIIAGSAPLFRVEDVNARVRLERSVVAPGGLVYATLAIADRPSALDWQGRDNLYGRFRAFLRPIGGLPEAADDATIASYKAWADDPDLIRETRSESTAEPIWAASDPRSKLEGPEPSGAFEVAARSLAEPSQPAIEPPGSTPFRPRPGGLLASLLGSALSARPLEALRARGQIRNDPNEPVAVAANEPGLVGARGAANAGPAATIRTAEVERPSVSSRPETAPLPIGRPIQGEFGFDEEPEVRPMPIEPDPDPDPDVPTNGFARETSPTSSPRNLGPRERPGVLEEPQPAPVDPFPGAIAPVRDASGLARAIRSLADRGGTIELASNARIELDVLAIPRVGRWSIRAAPGFGRPRIDYRPSPTFIGRPPALFQIAPGASLELEGIDLVLEPPGSASRNPSAFFGLATGSDLTINRCTITVGSAVRGTTLVPPLVVEVATPSTSAPGRSDATRAGGSASTVRIADSFLRSAGDLVDVAPDGRLDLTIARSVVVSDGALIHAHGTPTGSTPGPLRLVLRDVTSRLAGGLVYLESAPGRPELPKVAVEARDSILATDPEGGPLLRVDGQGALEPLRDRIDWEGRHVVYHRIETYRRDRSALSGTSPIGTDRFSWEIAVGPRESESVHGDARFRRDWTGDRPAWTADLADMRLSPDTPIPDAGPDLDLLPDPPAIEDY